MHIAFCKYATLNQYNRFFVITSIVSPSKTGGHYMRDGFSHCLGILDGIPFDYCEYRIDAKLSLKGLLMLGIMSTIYGCHFSLYAHIEVCTMSYCMFLTATI